MEFLKFFNKLFLLIFLLLLCYTSKCNSANSSKSVDTSSFLPSTQFYPEIFLNTSANLPIMSKNFKYLINKMMNHTKVCKKYLRIEIRKKFMNIAPRVLKDSRYKLFKSALNHINSWYINLLNNLNAGDNPEHFFDMDGNPADPSAIVTVSLNYIAEFNKEFMSKNFSTINNDFGSGKLVASPTYNIYNCLSVTVLNGYAQVVNGYRLDGNKATDETKAIFEGRREKFKETLISIGQQWQNVLQNIIQKRYTRMSVDYSIKASLLRFDYSQFMKEDFINQLFDISNMKK